MLVDDEASADLALRAADNLANADAAKDVRRALRPDSGLAGAGRRGAGACHERRVTPAGGPHFRLAVGWRFRSCLRALPVCPSFARAVRAATELDARTTVLSIDAVGVYDHISHASMLSGLQHSTGPASRHCFPSCPVLR